MSYKAVYLIYVIHNKSVNTVLDLARERRLYAMTLTLLKGLNQKEEIEDKWTEQVIGSHI